MSSGEEYLDNLLRSLTEGGDSAGAGAAPPAARDMEETDGMQDMPVSEESDMTMGMDDIEAILASMGAEPTEEEQQGDEAVSLDEEILSDESAADVGMLSEGLLADAGLLSDEPILDDGTASNELLIENMSSDVSIFTDIIPDESGLEEETLLEELAMDDGMISGELAVDDGMISGELAVDDGMISDELTVDDGMISDELTSEDSMKPDEISLDDSAVSDELILEDSALFDELLSNEGMVSDEFALDDGALSDEPGLDDSMVPDELSLDDVEELDDLALSDEAISDDIALEESSSDELSLAELGLEDLGLEGLGLVERNQDEPEGEEDFTMEEEFETEDFAMEEEPRTEEASILEEVEEDADLSALLASMSGDEELSEIGDLLEKSDQGVAIDPDMMAMLDSMSEGEDVDEAFDFFTGEEEGEGSGEAEGDQITPEESEEEDDPKTARQKKKEEKERKKREKQAAKAKKKGAGQENADDLGGPLGDMIEGGEEPKKQGFFGKFIGFLLEEDDEESENVYADPGDIGVVIGNLSDENREILSELNAEDKKNAKKKDKKEKKDKKDKKEKKDKKNSKAKQGKKGKKKDPKAAKKGKAKPKKPKKEKKKKEKNIEDELMIPEKKIPKKKLIPVILLCATIAACIYVLTMFLPGELEKQEARLAYDNDQYAQVYDLLYGKKLSEEDEELLQKSSVVLRLQRKLDSYENYRKMDMQLEALNALIEGVIRYQELRDEADAYNVGSAVGDIYGRILNELANNYGLSEADVMDIISSSDNVTYSRRLEAAISGEFYGTEEEELPESPEVMQDVLPEEEEIIDRLQGTETE